MDRLPALIGLCATLAAACDEGKKGGDDPPPSRVNASKGAEHKGATAEGFCDVHFAGDKGPKFTVPALVGGSLPVAAKSWRWVNVWATWCKPCVEEMPRLAKWREQLGAAGHPFELSFV